jgi:hypothetical protein
VAHWKWILQKRLNKFADAEIREVYAEVLSILRASRYGSCFAGYEVVDAASPPVLDEALLREAKELVDPNYGSWQQFKDGKNAQGGFKN